MKKHGATLFAISVVVFATAAVYAQDFEGAGGQIAYPGPPSIAITPNTYGVSVVAHTVQAFSFDPFDNASDITGANGFGSRFCTGQCFYESSLFLPAGAVITSVELDACDGNAAGLVDLALFRTGKGEATFDGLAGLITGEAATPGCGTFSSPVSPQVTVDNANNSYLLQVFLTGGTNTTRFQAVRVFYRLQVSPAPATATFPNDVPTTHPFFRFIEALAASGVTSGCAPGSFCPNSPITRGEMAVFLSAALGLHFAP